MADRCERCGGPRPGWRRVCSKCAGEQRRQRSKDSAPAWAVILLALLIAVTAATAVLAWRSFERREARLAQTRVEPLRELPEALPPPVEEIAIDSAAAGRAASAFQAAPSPQTAAADPPAQPAQREEVEEDPPGETLGSAPANDRPRSSDPGTATTPSEAEPPPTEAADDPAEPPIAIPPQPEPQHSPGAQAPPPPPERPRRARGRILLPGAQAFEPPVDSSRDSPAAPADGDIFWTGRLDKKIVVVLDRSEVSAGAFAGEPLPGVPVEVEAFSPVIEVVERPSVANGWGRLAFRARRNSKDPVTLNFHWRRTAEDVTSPAAGRTNRDR